MLSSVANYLFGSYPAEETTGAETETSTNPENVTAKSETFNDCKLTTSPADHDWELVDRIGDSPPDNVTNSPGCNSECCTGVHTPGTTDSTFTHCTTLCRQSQSSPKCISSDPHSSNSSAPSEVGSDHEGWLITPPRCFTAGGTTEDMEVSPLENLLIEHPSMSVYHKKSHKKMSQEEKDSSDSKHHPATCTGAVARRKARQAVKAVHAQPPRRPTAVAARAGILAEVQSNKSSQRQKAKQSARKNAKKVIERQNRVKELKSHGKRRNCSARKVNPSGRMSNRAC